mmetsp:Transcript_13090/g.27673  ORF Transcript_13090/g.27673 Transcript_13090/m.27673 type:complete len:213 (-) Transcript_13090:108-746(-)
MAQVRSDLNSGFQTKRTRHRLDGRLELVEVRHRLLVSRLGHVLLLTQARQVQRLDVLVEGLRSLRITAHTVHRLTHAVELTGQLRGHLTPRLTRDRLRDHVALQPLLRLGEDAFLELDVIRRLILRQRAVVDRLERRVRRVHRKALVRTVRSTLRVRVTVAEKAEDRELGALGVGGVGRGRGGAHGGGASGELASEFAAARVGAHADGRAAE